MNEALSNHFDDAIEETLERVRKFDDGPTGMEAKNSEVDALVKLVKARNDYLKPETDWDVHEAEEALKKAELKQAMKELGVKIGLGVLQVSVSLITLRFYENWTKNFMIFEKSGHIPSSGVFRNFMKEVRPKM